MIRIGGPSRTVGASPLGSPRKAEGGGNGFQPVSAEPAARATTSSAAPALGGLDALIALQSIDGDEPRKRRRAVKRGHEILDVLDEIKIGLLSGSLGGAALDRVTSLLAGLESSGDPSLDALIEDIALRAEVELAKLGRYLAQPRQPF